MCEWRSEHNFQKSVLSFHHLELGIELKLPGLAASTFTDADLHFLMLLIIFILSLKKMPKFFLSTFESVFLIVDFKNSIHSKY